MAEKITVATTWLQTCSGCHMSFLDLDQDLFELIEFIEIKHSPLIDVKDIPKVKIGIVDGAVGNEHDLEVLKKLREQSEILISLGTCANYGGLPSFRNLFNLDVLLKRAYVDTESTVDGYSPSSPELPKLFPNVKRVSDVVKVDYMLPGCPPVPSLIKELLFSIMEGKPFSLPGYSLCKECNRQHYDLLIPQRQFLTFNVLGICELDNIKEGYCFLEQGVLCLGLVTRAGCHAVCVKSNTPCRGCMGPTSEDIDQGAKLINALANILPTAQIIYKEDVVGTGYRFSTAASVFDSVKK